MGSRKDKEREPQLGMDGLFERAERAAPKPPKVYGVGEIVRLASRTLEDRFRSVWVEGEVSNVRRISSGHVFFSLKDGGAQLSAVMFRSVAGKLRFRLKDGDAVRCRGSLRIYEAQGRFQLYVERVEPVGLGELMLALEELKAKLAAEGLFDEARKRPLPRVPRVVGVVTSATGAALRDIIKVAGRRCPVRIVVSPAAVQGADAPPQIVRALERLARLEELDVAIVGRGGGSLEDLWCFNDERVARAVAAFPRPIVSAVGHEIDFTLSDYAADWRAATPSAAAERVVPDRAALLGELGGLTDRLGAALRRRLDGDRFRLSRARQRLGDPRHRLLDARATLDGLATRMSDALRGRLGRRRQVLATLRERVAAGHPRARLAQRRGELARLEATARHRIAGMLERRRDRLQTLREGLPRAGKGAVAGRRRDFALLAARLNELSPLRVLARGYAVAVGPDEAVVRSWDQVETGDPLRLRLAEGELGCEVTERVPGASPQAPPKAPVDPPDHKKIFDQGSGDER